MNSTAPRRLQRHRNRSYRLPPGAVYVGRPTQWGNPYRVEQRSAGVLWEGLFLEWVVVRDATVQVTWPDPVADAHRAWVQRAVELFAAHTAPGRAVAELAGRDLACWCLVAPSGERWPCQADVLLTLATSGGVA